MKYNDFDADTTMLTINDTVRWNLPAVEYVKLMFERTKPTGKLYEAVFDHEDKLPGPDSGAEGNAFYYCYECTMDWTESDRDRVIEEYNALYSSLAEIAKIAPELPYTADASADLPSTELLAVWNTYIREFGYLRP